MKQLELDGFGFMEIDSDELVELKGGWRGVAIAVGIIIMDNWRDIRDGFNDGTQGKARY